LFSLMENASSRHYAHYHAEQFAADEAFVRWVQSPDAESNAYWTQWLQTHPEKEDVITEARRLVKVMRLRPELPDAGTKAQIWEKIRAQRSEVAGRRPVVIWWRNWQAAASVVLVVALGLFARYWFLGQTEISTAFGETRSVELPDGSLVTLNGNSTLRYDRRWNGQDAREVWLEGEAFFKVRKKPSKARFVAHAGPADIIVLGTQFNVRNRRGKTRVLLTEGKVQLKATGSAVQPVIIRPGEVADISPKTPIRVQFARKPALHTAWQEQKLVFDDTPLREVALQVEDAYGITLRFGDPALADLKLRGEVYVTTAKDIAEVIAESFALRYQQKGNTLTFQKP
jgi:ferric-dicitrate binding protein FerR (iron transport regulator)